MTGRVIALGFFDGVHLGHGRLLMRTVQRARQLGCTAAAMTFDRYPGSTISGVRTGLISSLDDRTALMKELYAIEEVLCPSFDRSFMQMPWQTFVEEYLHRTLQARYVVCGYDYRFGCGGEGTPERLQALCRQLGMGCDCVEKLALDGVTISSTHIRTLLAQGQTEQAARFLGHPHRLSGQVVSGQQLGRRLGIPTANLEPPAGVLLPQSGVYAVRAYVGTDAYTGVCNIGTRPTVHGGGVTVETWLDGFEGDLYDRRLRLDFYRRLRPERRFASLEEMKQEIVRNRQQARDYFSSAK
ncbi:MAG: riboflavin biosynthesis protein RibF [Faecousia sp.]